MAKIYTKTGDAGETGLWGGKRLSKHHPRVRAYGEIDELNSVIGMALSEMPRALNSLRPSLQKIQEELFVVGAILATPLDQKARLTPPFDRGVPPESATRLEREIDRMTAGLKPMKRFILPGGAPAGAWLHLARAVCRRAEREVVGLRTQDGVPDSMLVYLNRLSDFLFTAARWANSKLKSRETEWRGLSGNSAK